MRIVNIIVKQSHFRPQSLDPSDYLLSLLDEACQSKHISEADLQNFQVQIMDVLKDMIIRYTSGESSSVPVETAQNLLMSALFCMDVFCMSFPTPEHCLSELQTISMKVVYEKGLALVRSMVDETKQLFKGIRSSKISTPLVAYNSTINYSIPYFFTHYDATFNAHETTADIDYPLAYDDMDARGILYIKQYLEKLKIENQFCKLFAENNIDKLLENYGKIYRIDYPEFLLNIFEIVLTNSVFSVMLGKDARNLAIFESQLKLLNRKLSQLDIMEIPSALKTAMDILIDELGITSPQMRAYIHQCENGFVPRLMNSLKQDSLKQLIIPVVIDEPKSKILVELGETMDNDVFRVLVGDVLECADSTEKANLILSKVKSLIDFTDILNADCLFDDEYLTLFELLGDMEISVLARIIFSDELRDSPDSFSLSDTIASVPESETEWINQLIRFLHLISEKRRAAIERLLNTTTDIGS